MSEALALSRLACLTTDRRERTREACEPAMVPVITSGSDQKVRRSVATQPNFRITLYEFVALKNNSIMLGYSIAELVDP